MRFEERMRNGNAWAMMGSWQGVNSRECSWIDMKHIANIDRNTKETLALLERMNLAERTHSRETRDERVSFLRELFPQGEVIVAEPRGIRGFLEGLFRSG